MFSFFSRKPKAAESESQQQQQQHTPSPSLQIDFTPPPPASHSPSPSSSPFHLQGTGREGGPELLGQQEQETVTDPKALYALIASVPPKTLHEYTLRHLCPPSPSPFPFPSTNISSSPYELPNPNNPASIVSSLSISLDKYSPNHPRPPNSETLTHLTSFFASLSPPPKLHCVRCHQGYFDLENGDSACRVQHDDDSAIVERVRVGGRSEYETLYTCCNKTVEGDGDMGPPDGWCYEGPHTTDVKRARFRTDSTPSDDKLVSCISLRCNGPLATPSSPSRSRGSPTRRRTHVKRESTGSAGMQLQKQIYQRERGSANAKPVSSVTAVSAESSMSASANGEMKQKRKRKRTMSTLVGIDLAGDAEKEDREEKDAMRVDEEGEDDGKGKVKAKARPRHKPSASTSTIPETSTQTAETTTATAKRPTKRAKRRVTSAEFIEGEDGEDAEGNEVGDEVNEDGMDVDGDDNGSPQQSPETKGKGKGKSGAQPKVQTKAKGKGKAKDVDEGTERPVTPPIPSMEVGDSIIVSPPRGRTSTARNSVKSHASSHSISNTKTKHKTIPEVVIISRSPSRVRKDEGRARTASPEKGPSTRVGATRGKAGAGKVLGEVVQSSVYGEL